eukprot:4234271-Pyramimonas_sp.AAC.1
MQGTCVREWVGRTYHVERLSSRRVAIHFGWSRAPHTNSSAGCCIILGRRLHPNYAKHIQAGPSNILGRYGE